MQTATSPRVISTRTLGRLMVFIGAAFWGLSGTAAQQLFQHNNFSPAWLVCVRMGCSGILLLLIAAMSGQRQRIWSIWTHWKDIVRILVFGVVGLVGVQYTYFVSIQLGNAATATFLQYLAPACILAYVALTERRQPYLKEYIALGLALLGTFLLVTNGSPHRIVVPTGAVVFGLLSALALAFYTLYPKRLMGQHGSALTVGWGMCVGSAAMMYWSKPWHTAGQIWSLQSVLEVVFVVLFGTLAGFYLYMASMQHISPTETGLIASFEPLAAAIAAVVWLHTKLGPATVVGGLCIVFIVVILSIQTKSEKSLNSVPPNSASPDIPLQR